ncbi:MAG: DUF402 domain-containing protein, partial [Chloroflexota bacterium]
MEIASGKMPGQQEGRDGVTVGTTVTISKMGHHGEVIFSWQGTVIEEDRDRVVLRASWERDEPMFLGYTVFEPGDPFVETYYRGRWFSFWRIDSHRNGRTKGWYCNICRPIEVEDGQIRFEDMELDVFVYPDGRYLVLDEADLAVADVTAADKALARAALGEVVARIERREDPFERIGPPRRVAGERDAPKVHPNEQGSGSPAPAICRRNRISQMSESGVFNPEAGREHVLHGYTRAVKAPEGTVNITLNSDASGLTEIFVNVGKAGSDVAALAEALSRTINVALALPGPVSRPERTRILG